MLYLRVQIVLFVFNINGVLTTYETMRMTVPCVLNNSCDLPCRLQPYTAISVTVLWFNGHNEMLSQGKQIQRNHRNLKIEKPAFNEWTLRIHRVNRNDAGTYCCRTNNGDILSQITVIIEHKPKIDEQNSSSNREIVQENSVAQLNCIASSIPEPEITWHRGQSEEQIAGIKGHKLIIRDVKRHASDDYTCIATNRHGSAKRHIKLIVNFAPEVTLMEQEVYAVGGEEVTMGCMVQASPITDAYWTNNKGTRILNTTKSWKYEVNEEKESDIFPVRFLELRIIAHTLNLHDQGNYTCYAFGAHPEPSTAAVVLKVKDKK